MKKSKSKTRQEEQQKSHANASEFSHVISKIAVSQICQSVGFHGSQLSALEVLSDITVRYLHSLAKSAAVYADSANRSDTNIFDLCNSLHDFYSILGFPGCSNLYGDCSCVLNSGALYGLISFVQSTRETPFAKPIPRKDLNVTKGLKESVELNFRGDHIPEWLPPFPDESTYKVDRVEKKVANGFGGIWESNGDAIVGNGNCVEGNSDEQWLDEKMGERGNSKWESYEEKKKRSTALPKKRKKVRFRIGVERKSGVYNDGKKMFFSNWFDEEKENGEIMER